MTPSNGPFPGPDVNYSGAEWSRLSQALDQRLDQRRKELENLELSEAKRLILLGRIAEIKDILSLPELQRRRAKMREGALASYE